MREIKFRAKNREGVWFYGFLTIGMDSFFIEERHELPPTMSDPCGDCIVTRESIIPDTIGEYTGLKDVFEDDRVMFNGRKIGIVSMVDGTWTIIPEDKEKDRCTYFLYHVKQLEIIGNIHIKDSPSES